MAYMDLEDLYTRDCVILKSNSRPGKAPLLELYGNQHGRMIHYLQHLEFKLDSIKISRAPGAKTHWKHTVFTVSARWLILPRKAGAHQSATKASEEHAQSPEHTPGTSPKATLKPL